MRCAIYTRKSSDAGLEQDFNSLDAQAEACAAYVASQRHEGWELGPARYDDGGLLGGTLERPGLQWLLDPLEAVSDVLKGRFDADPGVTGRQLLDGLQVMHPDDYPDSLIRTVQRRLKAWRRERAKSLVLGAIDAGGASGGLSDEALRWLRAPRPAGEPPAVNLGPKWGHCPA